MPASTQEGKATPWWGAYHKMSPSVHPSKPTPPPQSRLASFLTCLLHPCQAWHLLKSLNLTHPFFLKLNLIFLLKWVDLQCCVNFCCIANWFGVTHTRTFLFIFLSIMVYFIQDSGYWLHIAVLCRGPLLFICSTYTSLHLLTQNSQSIPPLLPSPLGNHRPVFCLWVCFVGKCICVLF